jgi:hypothetical protein
MRIGSGICIVIGFLPWISSCSDDPVVAPLVPGQEMAWRVQNVIPITKGFQDVWGSSGGDIFAVGRFNTAIHFDGSSWTEIAIGGGYHYEHIWGSGPNDVYVTAKTYRYEHKVFHFDGANWTSLELEGLAWYSIIWGSSQEDVYIGSAAHTIHHFDGTQWSTVDADNEESVKDIWGSGPEDVYVLDWVGELRHFDGSQWSPVDVNIDFGIYKPSHLVGLSSDNILLVGLKCAAFDGTSWTEVAPIGDGTFEVDEIAAWPPHGYLAIGGDAIWHFDGSRWGVYYWKPEVPVIYGDFEGIWVNEKDGEQYAVDNNGGVWKSRSYGMDYLNQSVEHVTGMWGSDARNLYAIGDNGSLMHFDGQAWGRDSISTTDRLRDIWGGGADDIYITTDADVHHFDGGDWKSVYQGPFLGFDGIWGFDSGEIICVGSGGIARYDGSTWIVKKVNAGLENVWGATPDDVWAVSNWSILRFDGNEWKLYDTGQQASGFRDIWGSARDAAYAVSHRAIYHFNGWQWEVREDAPGGINFRGIIGIDEGNIYVLAAEHIYHYDGSSLRPIYQPPPDQRYHRYLTAFWPESPTNLFAGGYGGLLMRCGPVQETVDQIGYTRFAD